MSAAAVFSHAVPYTFASSPAYYGDQVVQAKAIKGGDSRAPVHGTVGLLSEEGREYASPFIPAETVICE